MTTKLFLIIGICSILTMLVHGRPASVSSSGEESFMLLFKKALDLQNNNGSLVRAISIDDAIDENLEAIRCVIARKLEPVGLPDRQISDSFLVHNGLLHRLSTLKRTGSCSLYYANRMITLELNVGWDDISMDYQYLYALWWFNIEGSLLGWTRDIQMYLEIGMAPATTQVKLLQARLESISDYGAQVTGHWYDFLLNWLISLYKTLFGSSIYQMMEQLVAEELRGIVIEVDWLRQGDDDNGNDNGEVVRSCGLRLGDQNYY